MQTLEQITNHFNKYIQNLSVKLLFLFTFIRLSCLLLELILGYINLFIYSFNNIVTKSLYFLLKLKF